nr:hypothetical protein [uncultured bacterium]
MARDPIPFAPMVMRGAFVQLVPQMVAFLPNIILFRINPDTIRKTGTPFNPFEGQGPNRGSSPPDILPYPADETISFTLMLSATEGQQNLNPITLAHGVAPQIAALKKLIQPGEGLIGDLIGAAKALAGGAAREIKADRIPVTFLLLGLSLAVPVRATSFTVEETHHTPTLYPQEAKVSIELRVLTPDLFKCREDALSKLAINAYNANKLQEDALAVANIANNVEEIVTSLPI